MESARLAYISGETQAWNPQTGSAQVWRLPGHDKGPSSELSDWPHCAGKLKHGNPSDLVILKHGITQVSMIDREYHTFNPGQPVVQGTGERDFNMGQPVNL